jgi:phospholipase/lecithinase/hemolysin
MTRMTRRPFTLFAPISIAAVTAAMLVIAGGPASAFDRLWVFGDGTVDTGWYNFRPSGNSKFDKWLSTYNLARPPNTPPTYEMGKATSNPGPVSVEVLGGLIGSDVLPADEVIPLQTLPLVVNQAAPSAPAVVVRPPPGVRPQFFGTNYATGGARNHETNPPGIDLFPNAAPTETQIANYLSQHRQLYNNEFFSKLTALGVSFAWADMNSVRRQIVDNPTAFGIKHTTNALIGRSWGNERGNTSQARGFRSHTRCSTRSGSGATHPRASSRPQL